MKITADANVLVRAIAGNDARQSKLAQAELAKADLVGGNATCPLRARLGVVAGLQRSRHQKSPKRSEG